MHRRNACQLSLTKADARRDKLTVDRRKYCQLNSTDDGPVYHAGLSSFLTAHQHTIHRVTIDFYRHLVGKIFVTVVAFKYALLVSQ